MPTILAIETSCDDTCASVIVDGKILSNIISSQKEHIQFGGVFPEFAARAHNKNIVSIVQMALSTAKIHKNSLDAIAYTYGPGLLGSLMVGIAFAKAMAVSLQKKLIAINHIEGHMVSPFIDKIVTFPYLCLIVSGGHTELLKVEEGFSPLQMGKTLDDAVGEAFDKIAKMIDISYPGGAEIDTLAKTGNPKKFVFPRYKKKNLNFSFSGVKTAVRYFLEKEIKKNKNFIDINKRDFCASVQYCLVETLIERVEIAIKETGIKNIAIAGGVSANTYLRKRIVEIAEKHKLKAFIPQIHYCTDNAAMIAQAAYQKYLSKKFTPIQMEANPQLYIPSK